VDKSALTGESLPVTSGPGDAVYSGSVIKQGEIGALVYATGTGTYFGKTAELVAGSQTVSHFQRAVLKIGTYLIILAGVLVAVITVVSIIRGNPVLDTLQFALVLTVAAIPVAMPTVLSVTMAAGGAGAERGGRSGSRSRSCRSCLARRSPRAWRESRVPREATSGSVCTAWRARTTVVAGRDWRSGGAPPGSGPSGWAGESRAPGRAIDAALKEHGHEQSGKRARQH
jgi:hypothetical protein